MRRGSKGEEEGDKRKKWRWGSRWEKEQGEYRGAEEKREQRRRGCMRLEAADEKRNHKSWESSRWSRGEEKAYELRTQKSRGSRGEEEVYEQRKQRSRGTRWEEALGEKKAEELRRRKEKRRGSRGFEEERWPWRGSDPYWGKNHIELLFFLTLNPLTGILLEQ
jgi:hypothetical protein